MAKLSKRVRAFKEKVDPQKAYPLDVAVNLLKEFATVKFNETVEVAVNLGIDARKSDQAVRGATTLPFGTGSVVRVAVYRPSADGVALFGLAGGVFSRDTHSRRITGRHRAAATLRSVHCSAETLAVQRAEFQFAGGGSGDAAGRARNDSTTAGRYPRA